jgi:hypothetical protein
MHLEIGFSLKNRVSGQTKSWEMRSLSQLKCYVSDMPAVVRARPGTKYADFI